MAIISPTGNGSNTWWDSNGYYYCLSEVEAGSKEIYPVLKISVTQFKKLIPKRD